METADDLIHAYYNIDIAVNQTREKEILRSVHA